MPLFCSTALLLVLKPLFCSWLYHKWTTLTHSGPRMLMLRIETPLGIPDSVRSKLTSIWLVVGVLPFHKVSKEVGEEGMADGPRLSIE